MSRLNPYRKTLAAVVGVVTTWGVTAQADGIDGAEWWGLAAAVAGAFSVFQVANEPTGD